MEELRMSVLRAFLSVSVVALAAGPITAGAVSLETKNLKFEIGEDASAARFVMPANGKTDGDFWRLILDDGERIEMPARSRAQKGRVVRDGDSALVISYDEVRTEYGDTYPVRFTLRVEKRGELLAFIPTVEKMLHFAPATGLAVFVQ